MPVSTLSAAVHITPVVIKTFLRHGKRLARKRNEKRADEAQDDILFDEAFHIVQAFIELGTKNTVESLQRFTNTHVPAPYWSAVASVCIPFQSCNEAADILINWFGPDELKAIVGGERWWQVRGLDGVDGEWITQKDYLSDAKVQAPPGRKLSVDDQTVLRMENLDRVMVSFFGGYFWGSINTHRYQLIRYSRKIKGRVFAKGPSYPWPCPLQDVLAAYLYLIRPPPNAVHKAIPPSKIVFAGDSAGGGLCLSTLSILRDMGLPMPAGTVLISPWVDMTHSFPSVMQNTETDIIPQHGFLAKPSTLWPVDPVPTKDDQLRPTKARVKEEETDNAAAKDDRETSSSNSAEIADPDDYDVQMNDPNAVPLELHAKSNSTPPPSSSIRSNGRRIIYIAHRAAYPEKYHIRKGAVRGARRQQENLDRYTEPTKVHLQVFDDMCHVLTVFTFTESAKHAYRSIGAFVKHVTGHDEVDLARNPFPQLHRPLSNDTVAAEQRNPSKVPSKATSQSTAGSDDTKVNSAAQTAVEKVTEVTSALENPGDVLMIRERVNIEGIARPMESQEEMSVLRLKPAEIGIIKEAPTIRWLKGQEEWDKKYKQHAERAVRQKQKNEEKAKKLIAHAREQGLLLVSDAGPDLTSVLSTSAHATDGTIQHDRRWGPLDLDNESPRRQPSQNDRIRHPDALALLKKHIYHTAPTTHRTIPKLKLSDAVRAAFDPNDDPNKPPKQSVSEAQVHNSFVPDSLHGLKIWDVLVGYFMRKSQEKATNGKNAIKEVVTGGPVVDSNL
ncbi:hypothetical protein B0H13DRAFT_2536479 [Mycena leptocephala]|nr:hypothetical protein B0H13DRAFT_2536479 [Mycena leptocephala]